MIRAGNLRHTIEVQRKTETISDSGSVVSTWATIATVRAEIVTASADEFLTSFGEAEAGNIVFRIWHRPSVDSAFSVLFANNRYNVKSVRHHSYSKTTEIHCVIVN